MTLTDQDETRNIRTGVDAILARHGGLSYLEIPAIDARQSAAFYEQVLGWNLQHGDTEDPRFTDATGHLIGRWVTGRAISREPVCCPTFTLIALTTPSGGSRHRAARLSRRPTPKEICGWRRSATPQAM